MSVKDNSGVSTGMDLGGVYPDPRMRQPLPPEMMRMVYAGPEVMSGNKPPVLRSYPNPKICPACGGQNQTDAKFCEDCGHLLKE